MQCNMKRLTESFNKNIEFLLEDKRGSIKNEFKVPGFVADYWHEISPVYSFLLFKWWVEDDEKKNEGKRLAGVKLAGKPGYFDEYLKVRGENPDPDDEVFNSLNSIWFQNFVRELKRDNFLNFLKKDKNYLRVFKNKTYEQARELYDTKFARIIEKKEGLIKQYPNKWYWVNLRKNQCEHEKEQVQHCGFDDRGYLVSLRDKKNRSFVTMTWNEEENIVHQIKGKQNKPPEEVYWSYVVDFFKETGALLQDFEIQEKEPKLKKMIDRSRGFSPGKPLVVDVLTLSNIIKRAEKELTEMWDSIDDLENSEEYDDDDDGYFGGDDVFIPKILTFYDFDKDPRFEGQHINYEFSDYYDISLDYAQRFMVLAQRLLYKYKLAEHHLPLELDYGDEDYGQFAEDENRPEHLFTLEEFIDDARVVIKYEEKTYTVPKEAVSTK